MADNKEIQHPTPSDNLTSSTKIIQPQAAPVPKAPAMTSASQIRPLENSGQPPTTVQTASQAKASKRVDYAATAAPGEIPPQPRTKAPITVDDLFAGIEAIDLTVPNFASNPLSANPDVCYRWVNFKVGEDESSLNYQQRKAQGFVNATLTDLKPESPTRAFWNEKMQAFINYDSILMKMDRKKYLGLLKGNYESQLRQMGRAADTERGKSFVRDSIRDTGAPATLLNKVQTFVPQGKEAERLFSEK